MIYGLWASATGIMTSNYRQDVISNNIANAETVGFKRDFVNMQQRRMAAQELPGSGRYSDPLYANMGGGTLVMPTVTDRAPGVPEPGNNLDAAIANPNGYFAVETDKGKFLTRDGQFMVDNQGVLRLANSTNAMVLDQNLKPIHLDPNAAQNGADTDINQLGQIVQSYNTGDSVVVATLAVKQGADQMTKHEGTLFGVPGDMSEVADVQDPEVRGGFFERSNADGTTELTELMKTQRLMEANANMLRYQDQTLARLMTDVGKV